MKRCAERSPLILYCAAVAILGAWAIGWAIDRTVDLPQLMP